MEQLNDLNGINDGRSDSPLDDSDEDADYRPDVEEESSEEGNISNEGSSQENIPENRIEETANKSSRWRKRRSSEYLRNQRKAKRNKGQEYYSENAKKVVKAREVGPSCHCSRQCTTKLNGHRETIFTKFWNLGSFDIQNSYLFGCIKIVNKKRHYPKKTKRAVSSRKYSVEYYVNVNTEAIKICKSEFMSVHGLHKSRGRVNNIVSQVASGSPLPKVDGRGKHHNKVNRISNEAIQHVKEHINLIPKYQSHYSRAQNFGKTYLNSDMSITRLYEEFYVPWCESKGIPPVSGAAYRKIFCTDFNIGFKMPKSDTCKTCDETLIKIEAAKTERNDELVASLTTNLNLHKARAKSMQDLLKTETADAKINNKKLVLTFDLQQALPIPKLTTGVAFYCRKLWLYNLGVHDCGSGRGHMFVWTEDIAKRGSDEIGSALIKLLENKLDIVELVLFTDNCPGQNKNWSLMALWLQMAKEMKFKKITHHFLVSGHTHLPSDRDFALIEKHHRKYAPLIYSPLDWHDIIKKSNKKNPFEVIIMKQNDFKDIGTLQQNVKRVSKTDEGNKLDFSGVFSFMFNSNTPNVFFVKHAVNDAYQEVNVSKKGRPALLRLESLPLKYKEPVKIPKKKMDNIKTLLPFIPPVYHGYYESLEPDANAKDDEAELLE